MGTSVISRARIVRIRADSTRYGGNDLIIIIAYAASYICFPRVAVLCAVQSHSQSEPGGATTESPNPSTVTPCICLSTDRYFDKNRQITSEVVEKANAVEQC
jgi:hypothetical protein